MSEPTVVSTPDWSTITEEILCPLCDYNLRGVAEPRCAECGYRFVWFDMLDPRRRHHPFLFEHHPRHKVWSFFKTTTANWQPWKFWTQLHATQAVHPRRLMVYWLIGLLPWLLGTLAVWAHPLYLAHQANLAHRTAIVAQWNSKSPADRSFQRMVRRHYGTIEKYMGQLRPIHLTGLLRQKVHFVELMRLWAIPTILLAGWVPITFLSLHAFGITMKKAQIKSAHIWRCAVYSGDLVIWLSLAGASLIAAYRWNVPSLRGNVMVEAAVVGMGAGIAVLLVGTLRLCLAYQHYLKFERPVATVLLAQAIVLLFYVNVLMINVWL